METSYHYQDLNELSVANIGTKVWLQGRLHKSRKQGKIVFIILRYQDKSIQGIIRKHRMDVESINKIMALTPESVIDLYGTLEKSPVDIDATSFTNFELSIEDVQLVSKADKLPFQIEDADNFGDSFRSDVGQDLRLNNRWLDLRCGTYNAIFKIQSAIVNQFRNFLSEHNFTEIHTPKLISTASESGATVFQLDYFGKEGFLAQSPQLYKQMAINADFDRVFEIGPVFRAEKSFTHRHLCEYVGLDLEMTIRPDKDYHEILLMMWNLLVSIFEHLNKKCAGEITIIKDKLPFKDLSYPMIPLIIEFKDGVILLREHGFKQGDYDDLSTENERQLGIIVKEKYNSDLFILDKYPLKARPFYTMPDYVKTNDGFLVETPYSCSYDVILRGQEISSGAQRINDHRLLTLKIMEAGIDPGSMTDYIQSFRHGSKKHGGTGFGMERILMLFLDLDNIRKASFCPRDPKRLSP
jgi:nondiscriminating aspartyl-tRNA synthetase